MENGSSGVRGGVTEAMRLHADAVYRVLRIHLKERADVEDAFQDVFIRLLETKTVFESEEHRKAWLLRTAINRSRDFLPQLLASAGGFPRGDGDSLGG